MWTWQTRKQQNGDKCGTTLIAGYRFIPLPWLAILSNQQLKWKGFHRDCPHSLIDCSLASRVLHVNPRSLTFFSSGRRHRQPGRLGQRPLLPTSLVIVESVSVHLGAVSLSALPVHVPRYFQLVYKTAENGCDREAGSMFSSLMALRQKIPLKCRRY